MASNNVQPATMSRPIIIGSFDVKCNQESLRHIKASKKHNVSVDLSLPMSLIGCLSSSSAFLLARSYPRY